MGHKKVWGVVYSDFGGDLYKVCNNIWSIQY